MSNLANYVSSFVTFPVESFLESCCSTTFFFPSLGSKMMAIFFRKTKSGSNTSSQMCWQFLSLNFKSKCSKGNQMALTIFPRGEEFLKEGAAVRQVRTMCLSSRIYKVAEKCHICYISEAEYIHAAFKECGTSELSRSGLSLFWPQRCSYADKFSFVLVHHNTLWPRANLHMMR